MSTHSLKEEYELCRVGNRSHEHFKLKVDDTYVYNSVLGLIGPWTTGLGQLGPVRDSSEFRDSSAPILRQLGPMINDMMALS